MNDIRCSDLEVPRMTFTMEHENYNVIDLDRSLKFYEKALGLTEKSRKTKPPKLVAYTQTSGA